MELLPQILNKMYNIVYMHLHVYQMSRDLLFFDFMKRTEIKSSNWPTEWIRDSRFKRFKSQLVGVESSSIYFESIFWDKRRKAVSQKEIKLIILCSVLYFFHLLEYRCSFLKIELFTFIGQCSLFCISRSQNSKDKLTHMNKMMIK